MIKKYAYISIVLFIFSFSVNSNEINYKTSTDYNKLFEKKILSSDDIKKYQEIFSVQEDCNWKIANKIILNIDNTILMGHVLAQRYLHPKCYRSKFIELSSWLKKYNDHYQARRIYRLAIRRQPDGYKSPKKPISAIGISKNENLNQIKSKKYVSVLKLSKNQRKEKNNLLVNIKSRVNKGWPTGALQLLKQKYVKDILDPVEIDQQKELISKGYFLANKNKLAIKYAKEAINRSDEHVRFANWTAGLCAWRLKDYKLAANFFEKFSNTVKEDPWHRSSGAFWAARSYEQLGDYEKINE